MKHVVRYPYVSIRCPETGDSILVKEGKAKTNADGDVKESAMWLYDGFSFTNLDDIVKYRLRKLAS